MRLAVVAHIRHSETEYDELLAQGWDREDARRRVQGEIDRVLIRWEDE